MWDSEGEGLFVRCSKMAAERGARRGERGETKEGLRKSRKAWSKERRAEEERNANKRRGSDGERL